MAYTPTNAVRLRTDAGDLPTKLAAEFAAIAAGGGGHSAPTLMVAASDSLYPDRADYVCDGVDDQVEINAALALVKNVFLMEGNYSAYGITVPDYAYLHGAGNSTKITLKTGATGDVITNSAHAAGNTGIAISDILIDGNEANAVSWSRGVELSNTSKSSIFNCWAQNTLEGASVVDRGIGIYVSDGSTDVLVKNCFATDCGHEGIGIRESSERVSVIGCASWDNDFEGIQVASNTLTGGCKDILISGNVISGHPNYGGVTVHGEGQSRISVLNNAINGSGAGIFFLSDTTPYSTYSVIRGNSIYDTKTHSGAISVLNNTHVAISDNLIVGGGHAGVLLTGADYVDLSGNSIHECAGYGIDANSAQFLKCADNTVLLSQGGLFTDGSYNILNGNRLKSNRRGGIVSTGFHTHIVGNSVINNNTDAGTYNGIYCSGGYDSIKDNEVYLTNAAVGHQYGVYNIGAGTMIHDNAVFSAGTIANIFNTGSNVTIRNNIGYTTENSGTATLPSAGTSIAVAHGLAVTPSAGDIVVTPIEAWGSMTQFYIGTYTATHFTIHADIAPGADVDFAWKAIVL